MSHRAARCPPPALLSAADRDPAILTCRRWARSAEGKKDTPLNVAKAPTKAGLRSLLNSEE